MTVEDQIASSDLNSALSSTQLIVSLTSDHHQTAITFSAFLPSERNFR